MFLVLFGGKPRFEDTLKDALKSARSDERGRGGAAEGHRGDSGAGKNLFFVCGSPVKLPYSDRLRE